MSTRPVALITGSSRGIGLGIAHCLSATHDLVINGVRDESEVSDVLAELSATGASVAYAQGDISSAEGRDAILATTKERFGRLDRHVHNISVQPTAEIKHFAATFRMHSDDWMHSANGLAYIPHLFKALSEITATRLASIMFD